MCNGHDHTINWVPMHPGKSGKLWNKRPILQSWKKKDVLENVVFPWKMISASSYLPSAENELLGHLSELPSMGGSSQWSANHFWPIFSWIHYKYSTRSLMFILNLISETFPIKPSDGPDLSIFHTAGAQCLYLVFNRPLSHICEKSFFLVTFSYLSAENAANTVSTRHE